MLTFWDFQILPRLPHFSGTYRFFWDLHIFPGQILPGQILPGLTDYSRTYRFFQDLHSFPGMYGMGYSMGYPKR
jgi:hypothetical protein